MKQRKTFAAARFRVCANVFAASRIYFDDRRGAAHPAACRDQALARRSASTRADGDGRGVAAANTVH